MNFYGSYRFIPELNIVVEYFSGKITAESFIAFKLKVITDKDFKKGMHYLDDYRDATFVGKKNDVKLYLDFINKHENRSPKQKSALITNTPDQVVILTFFKLLKKDIPGIVSIFSTLEFALDWLLLSPEGSTLAKNVLMELKQNAPNPIL